MTKQLQFLTLSSFREIRKTKQRRLQVLLLKVKVADTVLKESDIAGKEILCNCMQRRGKGRGFRNFRMEEIVGKIRERSVSFHKLPPGFCEFFGWTRVSISVVGRASV